MSLHLEGEIRVDGFVAALDLTVDRGETVALVGPNGAGKSTVMRAIAGLLPLASGRLAVDGQTWDAPDDGLFVPPESRRVGVVFQRYLLFDHLTSIENVAFGLRANGADKRSARAAAHDALDLLGVGEVADRRPSALSGGQAQRVALARALVTHPAVLLLDEPLAALDVSTRGSVRHELAGWLVDGVAVQACRLLITHDPVDAHALADRVVVLEAGRVVQRGTLAELAAAPRSSYVADLMGTNLLRGVLRGGSFLVAGGDDLAIGAHDAHDGDAIAAIRPAAIALHRDRPEGSPRNVWQTTISGIDRSNDRVRVRLDAPLSLVVEVTEAGLAALAVDVGDGVWASVKASEISVVADG